MTALWASFLVVALTEMGDRTQLVAWALATQYRRPWTVMRGCCFPTRSRGRWSRASSGSDRGFGGSQHPRRFPATLRRAAAGLFLGLGLLALAGALSSR